MNSKFLRLVRFSDPTGQIYYGEAGTEWEVELRGREVPVYNHIDLWASDFHVIDKKATISEVLCPLDSVPDILAVGLNYKLHAEEAGVSSDH